MGENVVYLIDTSGSMEGERIKQCQNTINDLKISFSLYTFNTSLKSESPGVILKADGGTEISECLLQCMRFVNSAVTFNLLTDCDDALPDRFLSDFRKTKEQNMLRDNSNFNLFLINNSENKTSETLREAFGSAGSFVFGDNQMGKVCKQTSNSLNQNKEGFEKLKTLPNFEDVTNIDEARKEFDNAVRIAKISGENCDIEHKKIKTILNQISDMDNSDEQIRMLKNEKLKTEKLLITLNANDETAKEKFDKLNMLSRNAMKPADDRINDIERNRLIAETIKKEQEEIIRRIQKLEEVNEKKGFQIEKNKMIDLISSLKNEINILNKNGKFTALMKKLDEEVIKLNANMDSKAPNFKKNNTDLMKKLKNEANKITISEKELFEVKKNDLINKYIDLEKNILEEEKDCEKTESDLLRQQLKKILNEKNNIKNCEFQKNDFPEDNFDTIKKKAEEIKKIKKFKRDKKEVMQNYTDYWSNLDNEINHSTSEFVRKELNLLKDELIQKTLTIDKIKDCSQFIKTTWDHNIEEIKSKAENINKKIQFLISLSQHQKKIDEIIKSTENNSTKNNEKTSLLIKKDIIAIDSKIQNDQKFNETTYSNEIKIVEKKIHNLEVTLGQKKELVSLKEELETKFLIKKGELEKDACKATGALGQIVSKLKNAIENLKLKESKDEKEIQFLKKIEGAMNPDTIVIRIRNQLMKQNNKEKEAYQEANDSKKIIEEKLLDLKVIIDEFLEMF